MFEFLTNFASGSTAGAMARSSRATAKGPHPSRGPVTHTHPELLLIFTIATYLFNCLLLWPRQWWWCKGGWADATAYLLTSSLPA